MTERPAVPPPGAPERGRWPLLVAGAAVATTAVGAVLRVMNGGSLVGDFTFDLIFVGAGFSAVGGFLAWRVPGNAVPRIMLGAGALWSVDLLLGEVAMRGAVIAPGSIPGSWIATWLSGFIWEPGTALLLFGLPALFPDGSLPSRRWRLATLLVAGFAAVAVAGHAIVTWPYRFGAESLSPDFQATFAPGPGGFLAGVGDMGVVLFAPGLGAAALVTRYRRATGAAKEQLRWLTFGVVAMIPLFAFDGFVASSIPDLSGIPSAVALAILAASIMVAILRYRLYEIDRIVSRTVSWAVLTAALIGVTAALVLMLQAVLSSVTQGQTLAVAASTLAAAALFQPLRLRIQRVVDRRFYRARYDAERTSAAFAARLRDQVDLDELRSDLLVTVGSALRPGTTRLWVRGSPGRGATG